MADLLGLDRSTYSYYELGKIKPDIKTIMKLAGIFNVHYTSILESENNDRFAEDYNVFSSEKNTLNILKHNNLTAQEKNILIIFRMLPEECREEVITFLNNKFKSIKK